jgi:hypothetical protein
VTAVFVRSFLDTGIFLDAEPEEVSKAFISHLPTLISQHSPQEELTLQRKKGSRLERRRNVGATSDIITHLLTVN